MSQSAQEPRNTLAANLDALHRELEERFRTIATEPSQAKRSREVRGPTMVIRGK